MNVDPAPRHEEEWPQIVDPMRVVGVRMGDQHAVDMLHLGLDQLFAQVGPGVDQHGRHAGGAVPFDENRAAATAVAWIGRVAGTPPLPDPRDARRGAATKNGQAKTHGPCQSLSSLAKRRRVLARVAAARVSGSRPFASATTLAVAVT